MTIHNEIHTVYIRSYDRLNGAGTPTNFSYSLSIDREDIRYDRVVLLSASIPKSWYVVSSTSNTFILLEGLTVCPVTLTVGNYNATTMATELGTQLTAASLASGGAYTYTVAFATLTGKFTITSTLTGFSLDFPSTHSLYRKVGFNPDVQETTATTTLEAPNVINLQSYPILFVKSNCVDTDDSILYEIISNNTSDLSNISFVNPSPEYTSRPFVPRHSASFVLTDADDNVVDLNGLEINLVIGIYRFNDTHQLHRQEMHLNTYRRALQPFENLED